MMLLMIRTNQNVLPVSTAIIAYSHKNKKKQKLFYVLRTYLVLDKNLNIWNLQGLATFEG